MDFGEIGWKMANGQLLFLALQVDEASTMQHTGHQSVEGVCT